MLKPSRFAGVSATLALVALFALAAAASAKPIYMQALTPPKPPCPQFGSPIYADGDCTPIPEAFATTLPYPGNMAYYGGNVQTDPHLYLVYWGWGQPKAWPDGTACTPTDISQTRPDGTLISGTLACDPDGAGARMADFVNQMGGTGWAETQTQYYETDASGKQTPVGNPKDQLAGIWVDDGNQNNLPGTTLDNPAGPTNTLTRLGQEAERAVAHFGITDLHNSQILIVQPPGLNDPNSLDQGYCAFHDLTYPVVWDHIYDGIQPGIAYTNMPYVLALGFGCGQEAVNSGDAGKLDGFSIVLGHEIEETTTDPGAENVVDDGSGNPKYLGGWYDTIDANENADKCAWVGQNLLAGGPGQPNVLPVPGAMGNITGNKGGTFPVQSLWSNDAAGGTGWCAGAGTDLPANTAKAKRVKRQQIRKAHRRKRAHRTGV